MHRRIRSVGATLVATVAAAGLAACGSGSTGANELHVLVGANAAHSASVRAWQARIAAQFKAKTGATVVFDSFSSAGDEQTKIQTSLVSGTGPDVYEIGTTFTPVAYATGGFHTMTAADWAHIGGRDKFLPPSLAMSGPDPQHEIGVPARVRPYGMVYNTDLFQAAGISSPPTTWDDFLADARKLTNPSAGVYGTAMDYADSYNPWKYIWTLTRQSGSRLVSPDLRTATLDSPEAVAATGKFFGLLSTDHVVDPASVGWNSAQAVANFAAGKAAMLPMVTTQVENTLNKAKVRGKYAFVPLPLVPFGATTRPAGGAAAGSIVSGDDLLVAGYTKNLNLALDYVGLVTSPENQEYYYSNLGDSPSVTAADDQLAKTDPRAAAAVAAEAVSVPTEFTGAWADVELGVDNVFKQSLPGLSRGSVDPAAVRSLLGAANRTVQASLDRQHH